MKIKTEDDRVLFVADDGRSMFEVRVGKDQRSIGVRGCEPCIVEGVLYSDRLVIEPHVANSITVRVPPYPSE